MEKTEKRAIDELALIPREYVKPMAGLIRKFSDSVTDASDDCSPVVVAVAVAIVIVLSDKPGDAITLTDKEKTSLKYAVKTIRNNPELIRKVSGIDLNEAHIKAIEAVAK